MTATERPSELKACPFCGGDAEIDQFGDGRKSTIYSCTECGCRLETSETFAHGTLWNRRTLDAAPADPVVSAECWRMAVLEGCAIKSFLPSAEWFEQRAREIAKEQSRGR